MADICLSVSFQLDRSQLLEEISIFINKPMHYWDVTTDNVELKQSGIGLKATRNFCSIFPDGPPPPKKKKMMGVLIEPGSHRSTEKISEMYFSYCIESKDFIYAFSNCSV